MSWTLQESAVTPYLQACRAAAQGSDFFKTFKNNGAYRHVLEHVLEHASPTGKYWKCNGPARWRDVTE